MAGQQGPILGLVEGGSEESLQTREAIVMRDAAAFLQERALTLPQGSTIRSCLLQVAGEYLLASSVAVGTLVQAVS